MRTAHAQAEGSLRHPARGPRRPRPTDGSRSPLDMAARAADIAARAAEMMGAHGEALLSLRWRLLGWAGGADTLATAHAVYCSILCGFQARAA